MVLYSLRVKASLDYVESLYPAEGYDWFVKVKCSTCGEDSARAWHSISTSDEVKHKTGRGTVHFMKKCKFCKREGTLTVIKESVKRLTAEQDAAATAADDGYAELARFDCRGMEPVDFSPMEGWVVVTASGTTINDVDLSENDWVGYDESAKKSVGIYEFRAKFVRI